MSWVKSTIADMRAEPDSRAERVSQLIQFAPCTVLEESKDWFYVQGEDGYRGWIKANRLVHGDLPPPNWKVSVPFARIFSLSGRTIGWLVLDTRFCGVTIQERVEIIWPTGEKGSLSFRDRAYVAREDLQPTEWTGTVTGLLEVALTSVGVPYLWGGTSSFGFDCSGFVQRFFHFTFNRWLPRDTKDQMEVGKHIGKLDNLLPGDLAFFPRHVGLWAGTGVLLHANSHAGQVSLSQLVPPEEGYDAELCRKFTHGRRFVQHLFSS